jgi:hypothetical protein
MDFFLDLLLWIGWWFPVQVGWGLVRLVTFGLVRVDDEILCGVIGVLFLLVATVALIFLFW